MEGTGNDFVVVDGIRQQFTPTAAQLRFLADRHFGIGCDQILVVRPPARPGVDFRYEIFNADGGEVQNCGNGARCFVRFVRDLGLTQKTEIRVETLGGIIVPRLEADGQVTVDMGVPRFEPGEIPFRASSRATTYRLALRDKEIEISALSLGNPHAVQIVDDAMRVPVASDGPLIENHPAFPERVNAGFMQILNREHIRLRVFERGAGETLACGTGACAAVVAGITRGLLEERVRVTTNGGDLIINWGGPDQPVLMKGEARTVFKGEIEL